MFVYISSGLIGLYFTFRFVIKWFSAGVVLLVNLFVVYSVYEMTIVDILAVVLVK